MTVSNETVRALLMIVRRHVDDATLLAIFRDIVKSVPGNASFRATAERILKNLEGKM